MYLPVSLGCSSTQSNTAPHSWQGVKSFELNMFGSHAYLHCTMTSMWTIIWRVLFHLQIQMEDLGFFFGNVMTQSFNHWRPIFTVLAQCEVQHSRASNWCWVTHLTGIPPIWSLSRSCHTSVLYSLPVQCTADWCPALNFDLSVIVIAALHSSPRAPNKPWLSAASVTLYCVQYSNSKESAKL